MVAVTAVVVVAPWELVAVTAAVVDEMRAKHPAARPSEQARLADLRAIAASTAPVCTSIDVAKAVRSFSRGSPGGHSGLKPQHIKDSLVPGFRDELL